MDRSKIEHYAHEVLDFCGLRKPPFDPRRVAEIYSAQVIEQPADQAESGFCLRQGSSVIIGVNELHTPHRKRFTVAHEVGHLLLHKGRALTVDKVVRISYRNEISSMATDFEEIEANAFAAALLMPDEFVRQEVGLMIRNKFGEKEIVQSLSARFNVSAQAMNYRLVNLGIFFG